MVFKFEMSISDIISICALFATFITIRQVKQQREDMNKPYMIIDFNGNHNKTYTIKKDGDNNNEFDFIIKNIGNGFGKDVKLYLEPKGYEFLNDEENMKIINSSFLEYKSENERSLLNLNKREEYFPYIESSSCKNIKSDFYVYYTLIEILAENYFDPNKRNNGKIENILNSMPVLSVKIEYSDIFNEIYTNTFEISIEVIYFSINELKFNIKLNTKQ